jgi:SNF2 family DNA or RNA helicase
MGNTLKYQYKTKPRPHQHRALKRLVKQRGGGLQVPMRWGKTKTAIDFAACMHLLEGARRVLVIAPIDALGVWEDEIPKHLPDDIPLEWKMVNFESTFKRYYPEKGSRRWVAMDNHELIDFDADIVIVDEAHRIGNPSTLQSKKVYDLGRRARFRLLMTGTMFHRKPFYVFGQAKFWDPGLFGTHFSAFKNRIAIFGGHGGHEVLRYINLKWVMKRMKTFVVIEPYVPGEPPQVNVIRYHLTGRGLKAYADMEKKSVVQAGDVTVTSVIVLSRHLRCSQIAGGWLKLPDGRYRRVGSDQVRVAEARFQHYADEGILKVVVGCRFLPELRDAALAAKKAGFRVIMFHGGVPRGAERKRRIKDFQDTKDKVAFIAQLATARESIDLSAADTMMIYSISESYVIHDQFIRRIEKYQEKRTLQYDYLIAHGTRQEVNYEAMQLKKDVAQLLTENPKRVEQITSKLKGEK